MLQPQSLTFGENKKLSPNQFIMHSMLISWKLNYSLLDVGSTMLCKILVLSLLLQVPFLQPNKFLIHLLIYINYILSQYSKTSKVFSTIPFSFGIVLTLLSSHHSHQLTKIQNILKLILYSPANHHMKLIEKRVQFYHM